MKHAWTIAGFLFLGILLLDPLLGQVPGNLGQSANPDNSPVIVNRKPLQSSAFYFLPLTSIRPKGWLLRQLQIQADGLTGHLDEFWPDVGPRSGWLGGDGESWERGPYYMDGLIPLAYLLGDGKLLNKANKWVEWTLNHPSAEGWIGPGRNQDWWPNMVMLKVLAQYQEATGDSRVIPLMDKYLRFHLQHLSDRPLKDWAVYRWFEELQSVIWLYNRNGDPQLLELAHALQSRGFNWKDHFEHFPFLIKTSRKQFDLRPGVHPRSDMSAHGVNNAMALKASGLWWLVSGEESDREAVNLMIKQLDTYHGVPTGMFTCDEHIAGRDPSQGSELCSVVEAMYSLEQLVSILGIPSLADRLERIAFNALPATFSADMWAHQYDQQANQVMCTLEPRQWSSNGAESNVFGMEPNYGCCTANMHQGWPKLVSSLWMATPDGGLAAVAYASCEVKTIIKGNVEVAVLEETEYPFQGTIRITVNPVVPALFPIELRIPGWVDSPSLSLNGENVVDARAGSFYRMERKWKKGDQVQLQFPMHLKTSRSYHDSVVIERGPLLFSLKIQENWRKISSGMKKPAIPPAADWEVLPTTPWNYALQIDLLDPQRTIQATEKPIGEYPFSPAGAPVELLAKGRRVIEWKLANGSAGPLPMSPVTSHEPEETLTLIPYGSAKLRITEFPLLSQE